jgi:hypothetical protein
VLIKQDYCSVELRSKAKTVFKFQTEHWKLQVIFTIRALSSEYPPTTFHRKCGLKSDNLTWQARVFFVFITIIFRDRNQQTQWGVM